MAQLLTDADIERAILDAIATYNPGPNEIVPLPGIQSKLPRNIRADDINAALNRMVEAGLITIDKLPFLKLTDAGFAAM